MNLINKSTLPVWLIAACFVLFPFKRSIELPMLIMTIWGVVLLVRHGRQLLRESAVKFFSVLALCIWLPMLFSVTDSFSLKATGGAILAFIRLYFAGIFVIWVLRDRQAASLLIKLLAGVAAFWVIDALFQVATGYDLLGLKSDPIRITGVFGARSYKLGGALPVLAPFLILALRRYPPLMLLAAVLAGAVVVLAGSRGGWVSYAVVCVWLVVSEVKRRGFPFWKAAVMTAVLAVAGTFAVFQDSGARHRLDQTMLLFSGDEAKIDVALAYRLTLWKAALNMLEAHPINGVGVSAFRFAYPKFALAGDFFMQARATDKETGAPVGPVYAHQMVLEVATETGAIGFAGLVGFYVLLVWYWFRAPAERRIDALPFAVAAWAWIFPFNTHPSFYSAQWSIMIWLMIAMFCARLLPIGHGMAGGKFASAQARLG